MATLHHSSLPHSSISNTTCNLCKSHTTLFLPELSTQRRKRKAKAGTFSPLFSTFSTFHLPLPHPPLLLHQAPKLSACLSVNQSQNNQSNLSDTFSGDPRIIFSGGGSGGHTYPAIAIADELKTISPNAHLLFVGTKTGMEWQAVPSAGYDIVEISAVSLKRPFFSPENLLLPLQLFKSMVSAWKILDDFNPHVVVGTGGYVSAPVSLIAALRGIKLVIQEQNSSPGIANRILTVFATLIFVAFPSTVAFFPKEKCLLTGNPVRPCLRRYVSRAVAISHFFPRAIKKADSVQVVLFLGGSLGANAINIAVLNMYSEMLLEHKNRFIIWQTGVDGFDEMESLVKAHSRLLLIPFLHSVDLAYAAADLVVSRAGAMTCTEILTTGKPSILIPSPNVAEDHQTRNASIMAVIAGSKVLHEDELESITLRSAIEEVLGDEILMAEMCEKAMKAARPDASTRIAQRILSLVDLSAQKKDKHHD